MHTKYTQINRNQRLRHTFKNTKTLTMPDIQEGIEKQAHSRFLVGVKIGTYFGRAIWQFMCTYKNIKFIHIPNNFNSRYFLAIYTHTKCTKMQIKRFTTELFIIAKNWEKAKCSSNWRIH